MARLFTLLINRGKICRLLMSVRLILAEHGNELRLSALDPFIELIEEVIKGLLSSTAFLRRFYPLLNLTFFLQLQIKLVSRLVEQRQECKRRLCFNCGC